MDGLDGWMDGCLLFFIAQTFFRKKALPASPWLPFLLFFSVSISLRIFSLFLVINQSTNKLQAILVVVSGIESLLAFALLLLLLLLKTCPPTPRGRPGTAPSRTRCVV